MVLMLTITAGVVLGGLILIYRGWLLEWTITLLILLKSAGFAVGRFLWSKLAWLTASGILIGLAALFAFTRVEGTPSQWWVNQSIRFEMQAACKKMEALHMSATRESFSCLALRTDKFLLYSRGQCRLSTLMDGDIVKEVLDERCRAAG